MNPMVGTPAQVLATPANAHAILTDPAVELYLLYVAGAPAGYAEIDRRSAPEVTLAYFGLIPRYTGRGLGWYFLNWAIDTAWTGGTTRLTVNTCTLDHPKALQIYQRCGFTPLRQEHLRILDPRLTGIGRHAARSLHRRDGDLACIDHEDRHPGFVAGRGEQPALDRERTDPGEHVGDEPFVAPPSYSTG